MTAPTAHLLADLAYTTVILLSVLGLVHANALNAHAHPHLARFYVWYVAGLGGVGGMAVGYMLGGR